MVGVRTILAVMLLVTLGGCALVKSAERPGLDVLNAAFAPERTFAGDLAESIDDEPVLTVWASARDDYAPFYSLAIAFRCHPSDTPGVSQCGYQARMLRTASTIEEGFDRSLLLFTQAEAAQSASDMRGHLDQADLQWLETDVGACPNGIFAMDSIRVADWNPDIHRGLREVEDRTLILHPAQIKVTMRGSYTRSTYKGWVLAHGVPAAVRNLVETLEPCWKPATSPRPWRRSGNIFVE